jgi:hypothetical protein
MFGFTKLTPEEKIERDTKLRIVELDTLLTGEMLKRAKSLELSDVLRNELEKLLS